MKIPTTFLGLFLATALQAGPRTSANYNVVTDIANAGGTRSTSTAYTHDGSVGDVTGISNVAAPAETAMHGYIGQLTEVTALQLAATLTTVNETATRQLSGAQLLDDLTINAVPANSITWSIVSGPITSINTSGLATAGTVYQDTAATAQGIYADNTGTFSLTVLDTIPDNFGSYAGDGLGDVWQVQYFGLNNPNAAPGFDADFDGHDNLFEFTAGLDPASSSSRFLLMSARPAGQPGQMDIVIHPRLSDRTYTVKSSLTLGSGAVWSPLTGFTISDNGLTRTITDINAAGATKFYKVEITKP